MLFSLVVVCALVCSTTAIQFCLPEMLYEFASDLTPTFGSGYVQISPVSSVPITGGVANFGGTGTIKYYKLSAMDWRGDNLLSFTFQPTDPSLVADVSLMSTSLADNAGSLMVTWSANQVKLKVILRLWNTTTLQFDTRTEMLTISGLDLSVVQSVRVTLEATRIRFQSSPLIGGGAPTPLTLNLRHDEHIKIIGWDPLIFGAGTPTRYSGIFDEFAYFKCIPVDAFVP
ncbi:uncharacterized protein LOC121372313 [Gigantopelta aegis]|uniref:uncharacterized protein LOC121372313 n=1 Tax=Gigantopelta aegis TaxID=1735272 RepID=UPI001B88A202|nr:uncharacterized protein LOC121372313 [Gigantopelta aegis]